VIEARKIRVKPPDARLPQVLALLSGWDWLQLDGDNDELYDSPAVAVFNTWWQIATKRIFEDDLGATVEPIIVANLAYRLMVASPAVPLLHDYLGNESIGEALTASLISTMDSLQVQFGSANLADWHQPIATIKWTPLGLGTVPDTIWMNRGTYIQFVHLGKGPKLYGRNVVAPGQSGSPFSLHFSDQLELYKTWTYKPMRLNRQDLQGHIESSLTLYAEPK